MSILFIYIVSIPIQVRPVAIVRNNHRTPKILSALEHFLNSFTVLSLKCVSKGGGR